MKYFRFIQARFFAGLLVATFLQTAVSAQIKTAVNGYEKASYDALDRGRFMRNWVIAGPVHVTLDSLPDEASQEKAFREDVFSEVKVVNGAPLAFSIGGKNLSWQAVSSATE